MENNELLEQQAIDAAIKTHWLEAINLNKKILQKDKNNAEAYLRLAFAYLQTNKIAESKKCYKKALKLQPGNLSIEESLERIKVLETKKHKLPVDKIVNLDPSLFLESPGKTKSVALVNPGQKTILAQLTVGQEVIFLPKRRKIEVRTMKKEYIGSLPDDLSKRLTIFIKAGSKFITYIKESNLHRVVVFIREEKKGRKVMKYASFPADIQSQLTEMSHTEETKEEDTEEIGEVDLDKLAEILASEDKEYLPYEPEEQEEEPEE